MYRIIILIIASLLLLLSSCLKDDQDIGNISDLFLKIVMDKKAYMDIDNDENKNLINASVGLNIERAVITTGESVSKEDFDRIKNLVHENWYNETLKLNLSSSQYKRLRELRVKYGYLKSDAKKPIKTESDYKWYEKIFIVSTLFFPIILLAIWDSIKKKRRRV